MQATFRGYSNRNNNQCASERKSLAARVLYAIASNTQKARGAISTTVRSNESAHRRAMEIMVSRVESVGRSGDIEIIK
jgi:hypothetical protein